MGNTASVGVLVDRKNFLIDPKKAEEEAVGEGKGGGEGVTEIRNLKGFRSFVI